MQAQDQNTANNQKKGLRKSHLLIIGSLLVFSGIILLSYNHILLLRNQVFSDMSLAMYEEVEEVEPNEAEEVLDVPIVENVVDTEVKKEEKKTINYNKYLGVLEIPKIGLKRGFYNTDSKYNSIEYNVTLVSGSTMPNVNNGNLILMAHSGDAYISFFAYLYRLNIGDYAYVTYNGQKYKYKIVNIYNINKTGKATIYRNYDKTTLTLITCTKNDQTKQTIYIAELVS